MIEKSMRVFLIFLFFSQLVNAQSVIPSGQTGNQNQLNIPSGLMQQMNSAGNTSSPASNRSNQELQDMLGTYQSPNNKAATSSSKTVTKTNAEKAFEQVKQNMFPLAPEQIMTLRNLYNQNKQAQSITSDKPPRPTSSALIVNLEPGATPPVIRLGSGFVTSLIFLDATGAPWPIKAFDIGDPQSFSIKWQADTKAALKANEILGNTLLIQSNVMYKQGNLAVILKGLNTPVMLTLIPGQKSIDYRVDLQVPRNGPLAHPTTASLPTPASTDLLSVLNHIAPVASKVLTVRGGGEAWLKGSVLYLRTKYTVISPSWYSKMSSSDGEIHAYSLPPTSVILALNHGKTVKLSVGGI